VYYLNIFGFIIGLLYTPDREHFGIVPLEAMQLGLPVIAVNTGGPTETIRHQTTGYLCRQVIPHEFPINSVDFLIR